MRNLGAILTAFALLLGTAIPAAAAELMRVTFIRHGQSLGNASGSIDSSTPGPVLSELGYQQAAAVAARLGDKNYDGVYASSMVRTQLTAAPMSQYLGLPIQVIDGLQEIEAGDYEGTPESEASSGYMLAPLAWSLQGNLDARIPGSLDGHEFDARMGGALQAIYDSGSRNAVVFSHGAAMMFWTFMNVDNLTAAQKMELLRASLRNTADVVIEGNNEDGWKLVSWDGRQFSAGRTFGAEVKIQLRTLVRQLDAEVRSVVEAFATRDLAVIAKAVNKAVGGAGFSLLKFSRAVTADAIVRIEKAVAPAFPASAPSSAVVSVPDVAAAVAASNSTASDSDSDEPEQAPSATGLGISSRAKVNDSAELQPVPVSWGADQTSTVEIFEEKANEIANEMPEEKADEESMEQDAAEESRELESESGEESERSSKDTDELGSPKSDSGSSNDDDDDEPASESAGVGSDSDD